MSFDKKLQSLRKKAGLNQEELASELGVSRQAVSKWESGISYPEMDKLILMTRLFKCSLDDLVNDEIRNPTLKEEEEKKQYVDSFLEFITKSISMFNSMKLSSVIKCFLEIAALVLFLIIVFAIVFSPLEAFFSAVFDLTFYPLYVFFTSLIFFVLVILGAIIVFQFYKIRYLDYYDKLVYQYEVKSFNNKKNDENVYDEKEEKVNLETEKKESRKTKERIIIRDPYHKPLAFLSFFSKVLILTYRAIMRIITIPFVCLLVFLTIATVIILYLISYNGLFIGISIAAVASIAITVLIIRTLSDDLFKGPYPIKMMAILFFSSIFVGCIGIGISIISLNNIKFEIVNTRENVEKEYSFSDKLYLDFLEAGDNQVVFKVNDSLDNILINYNYDKKYESKEIVNKSDDSNYLVLKQKYINENPKEEIDAFLENLKKNLFVIYDYTYDDVIAPVMITASEKHIKQLINNISSREEIYVNTRKQNGNSFYYVYSFNDYNRGNSICEFVDFYRKCFSIVDKTEDGSFKYEYKNGKLIYDEDNYICLLYDNHYVCNDRD